ncbi:hypothetical protein P6166_12650 [Stenotrophomonas sp. HITSZ_GD]|uniref:hypothetical protein n=1 Tax=Stenotrophomonas sp. HITSZ_GD TaxID=3037248 RepID=UPI00240E3FFA|nr:hypothetical protein [Stenotrophomonas sp. HITSZ_GD]MDG2526205.1 hypothetical protein [Stenotrophomonas sp. HITSZ_GD]
MSFQTLLHQDGKWLAFDGEQVRRLDARPKIERASVALSDFDGAVSQVISLEGSPAHAVALIEKRLRADGLIDNESKILIHQTRTVGNGYQALFTAVPLDRWQQMFAWAEAQADHCLLVPTVALLWRMLKPGRGVVLHGGRQVVFVASLRDRILQASALAFSEAREDLELTVASLGERIGRELADGDADALQTLDVEWISVLTPRPADTRPIAPRLSDVRPGHDDWPRGAQAATTALGDAWPLRDDPAPDEGGMTFDGQFDPVEGAEPEPPAQEPDTLRLPVHATSPWLDEALLEIFAAHSGASVRLGPHQEVRDEAGAKYRSGVAHLAHHVTAMIAVNPPASRLMYIAERLLPWASAASLVLAVALAGMGGSWTLLAHEANGRADTLRASAEAIDQQIAALQPRQALPEQYAPLVQFIERAGKLQGALDPYAALASVREAAGHDVRILRLRLEEGAEPVLRVDGVVNNAVEAHAQGRQVARFVERLRMAGYVPVALDPQSGNARAQTPGGAFSYQLKRVPPQAAGKAS